MQTAEHGHCLDRPVAGRRPRDRLLLLKSLMRPGRVVEADVLDHEISQMVRAEDEYVVEELAAESADEAFGKRVHLWRPRRGSYHARADRREHGGERRPQFPTRSQTSTCGA